MKIMFSLDFSSPGTVFLIYGSDTHVKMVQRHMPKWLRDAFQNGSETHAKMAQRRIPKWHGLLKQDPANKYTVHNMFNCSEGAIFKNCSSLTEDT